jgi:hypothetical protein
MQNSIREGLDWLGCIAMFRQQSGDWADALAEIMDKRNRYLILEMILLEILLFFL